MKKETFVALFLGVLFGISVAIFFILSAKEKAITDKNVITAPSITISPVNFKAPPFEITDPANNASVNKNSIVIKGKAAKGALLVFSSPTSDKVLKITSESFEINFPVSLGENIITVTSYFEKDTEEKMLKIYYLE